MRDILIEIIQDILEGFSVHDAVVHIEYPSQGVYGDYATNVAMVHAKDAGKDPCVFAEEIAEEVRKRKLTSLHEIRVAGPGFINFYLSKSFFETTVQTIFREGLSYGRNTSIEGERVMVEHTDPNPFKEFHIGHLMPNSIGEALARIFEWNGASVSRANYQGDVGLHVAKTLWALQKQDTSKMNAGLLGAAYAKGAGAYESGGPAREEIGHINRKLYAQEDLALLKLYEDGKRISLGAFEKMYRRLGTHFDYYFFESETGQIGKKIVEAHMKTIFEESEGAIVFKGEKYGLHTRVFVTKEGYPTYEAKELGLAKKKWDVYPHDLSLIVTAREVEEYFKVLLKVIELIDPNLSGRMRHVSHGVLRLPEGKMSSRTGDVITANDLLDRARRTAMLKVQENKEFTGDAREKLADLIAVGAVKYSILQHSPGSDIVFDFDTSLSFEGDSGPYLQYTYVRTQSVLGKARMAGITWEGTAYTIPEKDIYSVERLLHRFPEIVRRAREDYAPHYIVSYATELAQAFNAWYGRERIIDAGEETPHRLGLTEATATVLRGSLSIINIGAPEQM